MKKNIFLGASLAIMGLAIAPAIAQTQSTTTSTTTGYIQSSTVLGAKIKDSRGEEVGVIKDFVLDRNTGCLAYVVISTGKGGILSANTKTVAAPWAVFSASADPKVYVTRIERGKIDSAPVWESTRVEEYSRTDYLNNVYGYYGVPAPRFSAELSVGVNNATSAGTTSTNATGTTSRTNENAAPSTTAAPTVGAPPTPAATAAVSPLGTPERTAAPLNSPPTTSSPKAPAHSRGPARETSSPSATKRESASEKKSADEPEKKAEKASTRREPSSESASEFSNKPSKAKKQHSNEPSSPETASTPKEP